MHCITQDATLALPAFSHIHGTPRGGSVACPREAGLTRGCVSHCLLKRGDGKSPDMSQNRGSAEMRAPSRRLAMAVPRPKAVRCGQDGRGPLSPLPSPRVMAVTRSPPQQTPAPASGSAWLYLTQAWSFSAAFVTQAHALRADPHCQGGAIRPRRRASSRFRWIQVDPGGSRWQRHCENVPPNQGRVPALGTSWSKIRRGRSETP